jgi:hypothetical protein
MMVCVCVVSAAAAFAVAAAPLFISPGAQDNAAPKSIKLPKKQVLVSVNWRCAPAGYCEPWIMTKPAPILFNPTTYRYTNADGTETYVIQETE